MKEVRALFFDVFGTLMDWRTSVAQEAEQILRPLGYALDWLAFADAWRDEYQPAMEEVRSGRRPLDRAKPSKQSSCWGWGWKSSVRRIPQKHCVSRLIAMGRSG